jgi:hypothetical protein
LGVSIAVIVCQGMQKALDNSGVEEEEEEEEEEDPCCAGHFMSSARGLFRFMNRKSVQCLKINSINLTHRRSISSAASATVPLPKAADEHQSAH